MVTRRRNASRKLFTDHLLIAAALVNAAKAGESQNTDEQRRKWYANSDDIATFLSEINLYWSKAAWRAMLYDHLKMTENEAVQLLNGQYPQSVDIRRHTGSDAHNGG